MSDKPAPSFRSSLVAEASGIAFTNMEWIVKAGLSPASRSAGKGSVHRYSSAALAHWALVGAMHKAGLPAKAAAKIGFEVVRSYPDISGRTVLLDNLDCFYRQAPDDCS